jgi:hypothetical protein
MGEPLGIVEKQNLLQGVVSDDACKITTDNCRNGGICKTTWNDYGKIFLLYFFITEIGVIY